MKIITWNCNCSFRTKLDHLRIIDFDLAIIQECEKEIKDLPETWEYLWVGNNINKGMAVIGQGNKIKIDKIHKAEWSCFLPVTVNDGEWFILAVWAYNHRARKNIGESAIGYPLEIFERLSQILPYNNSMVVGDFNNSVVWDRPSSNNSFIDIVKKLESFGLTSAYHTFKSEEFGCETNKTFFHNKKESMGHHIDYIFIPDGTKILNLEVGQYSDWINYSDHVPIQIEI
jgi:hypothetical protein